MSGENRSYSRCYGAPFMIQISGSVEVAPGMLFNEKYKDIILEIFVRNVLKTYGSLKNIGSI